MKNCETNARRGYSSPTVFDTESVSDSWRRALRVRSGHSNEYGVDSRVLPFRCLHPIRRVTFRTVPKLRPN